MIVFNEFIQLCARIDRILSTPAGSMLLAGRSGVGRRSAVSIVANMHQMRIFSPKVSSNGYMMKHFRADLKQVNHYD